MNSPLVITFRGLSPTDELRDLVREQLGIAAPHCACASCRVILARHADATLVHADVELRDPRDGTRVLLHAKDEDAATAVRKAFEHVARIPSCVGRLSALVRERSASLH